MCKNSVMSETSEGLQEAKAPARGGVGQPTLRIPRLLLGCVCDLGSIICDADTSSVRFNS